MILNIVFFIIVSLLLYIFNYNVYMKRTGVFIGQYIFTAFKYSSPLYKVFSFIIFLLLVYIDCGWKEMARFVIMRLLLLLSIIMSCSPNCLIILISSYICDFLVVILQFIVGLILYIVIDSLIQKYEIEKFKVKNQLLKWGYETRLGENSPE